MTAAAAVVFAFAVPDGLVPVVGAAPYEVLARQLPRQLVQLLNGGGDRGVRFFPFLGVAAGSRTFLRMRELLAPDALLALPKCEPPACIVDGMLTADRVQVRIHGGDGALRRDVILTFDARQPFAQLARLQFEIATVLGWTGPPTALPPLADAALAWHLVAKDRLLAIEAGIADETDADPLRAARESARLGAAVDVVQDVVLETAAQCARRGERRQGAIELLAVLLEHAPDRAPLLHRIGLLLQALGDEAAATAPLLRAARAPDATSAMAEAAAGLLFRHDGLAAARDVLQAVRARGVLEVTGLGQLAAVADRLGDRALRDAVVDELAPRDDLPPPVARIAVSFLGERERHDEARRVAAAAVARHPREAALWLELGRTELLLANEPAAATALEHALAAGLPPDAARDAARLLHFARVPGLFAAMREVDAMLARGERVPALRAARSLVRRSDVAQSWLFLGIVRQRLQRERLAERALRRALAADNGLAEAHNRLGILLVGRGELELGLGHLQRAERLSPDDPSPKLHLAQTCALLGRRGEGERLLDVAARLGANPTTVAAIRQQFFAA